MTILVGLLSYMEMHWTGVRNLEGVGCTREPRLHLADNNGVALGKLDIPGCSSVRRSIFPGLSSFCRNCVILVVLLLAARCAGAQDQTFVWPEVDTFVKLSPRTRLVLIASLSNDQDTQQWDGEFGPNVDVFVRPFLRPKFRDLDPAKSRLLSFRLGYRYLIGFGSDAPSENRIVTEATPRAKLPWSLLLSDRNRFDWRFVSDKPFSWRYRNRLTLERNFSIRKYEFSPYVRAELFYDSRTDKIAKNVYTFGSAFPMTKRSEFDMYYEDQRDSSSEPNSHARGVGLKLNLFF